MAKSTNTSYDATSVWAVIPTYDERSNLPHLLDRIWAAFPTITVLIVDDGSPDGTGSYVRARQVHEPRLQLHERSGKLGLGSAYTTGFSIALAAGATVVLQMDADLSHDPAEIPAMVASTLTADLVIGSRYVQGGRIENWPHFRRLLSRAANQYARRVLGLRIRDVTTGYRAWNAASLASLPLDQIRSSGYAFLTEMVMLASLQGFVITERPITFRDRTQGSSKMRAGEVVRGVTMLARIRLTSRRHPAPVHPTPICGRR